MSNLDDYSYAIKHAEINKNYLGYQAQIDKYKDDLIDLIEKACSKSSLLRDLLLYNISQDLPPNSAQKSFSIVFGKPDNDGAGAQFSWKNNQLMIGMPQLIDHSFNARADFINFIHENIHGSEENLRF